MNHMSVEAYKATIAAKTKRSKYGNKKVITADGRSFDSKREHKRWVQLCTMEQQGLITELERQCRYKFIINGKILAGDSGRPLEYVADFRYRDGAGLLVVEDPKGMKTDVYRIKKALMRVCHGIHVREI